MTDAVALQRAYYEATAASYDASHVEHEHIVALHFLAGYIELGGVRSVLDVGAGTGRAMRFLKARFPNLVIKGVEPVDGLRRRGHAQGIPEHDLLAGDGAALPFPDQSFDLVCEFAVLHHVRRPQSVIAEMSRVAARMIAISDCNFMGQGPHWLRHVKCGLWRAGLWPLADWIKTRGKRYTYSEGAEVDVLDGASRWLSPQTLLLIEVHKAEYLDEIPRRLCASVGSLDRVDQKARPLLGREARDEANWWLVSRLS